MDALSETLRVVRLVGAIFIHGPVHRAVVLPLAQRRHGGAVARARRRAGRDLPPDHRGRVLRRARGRAAGALIAGDVVVFPQGDAHRMTSEPGLPPAPGSRRLDDVLARPPRQLAYGGGGARTRLVCGYLACDARLARMLLAGLPPLVRVNVRGSNAGVWLEASVRYALAEARSPRPGGAGVLAKLAEVLFIEVLRLYMNEQSDGRTGWLAGVRRSHRRRRAERAAQASRACLDARGAGARSRRRRARCSPSASSSWSATRRCST